MTASLHCHLRSASVTVWQDLAAVSKKYKLDEQVRGHSGMSERLH